MEVFIRVNHGDVEGIDFNTDQVRISHLRERLLADGVFANDALVTLSLCGEVLADELLSELEGYTADAVIDVDPSDLALALATLEGEADGNLAELMRTFTEQCVYSSDPIDETRLHLALTAQLLPESVLTLICRHQVLLPHGEALICSVADNPAVRPCRMVWLHDAFDLSFLISVGSLDLAALYVERIPGEVLVGKGVEPRRSGEVGILTAVLKAVVMGRKDDEEKERERLEKLFALLGQVVAKARRFLLADSTVKVVMHDAFSTLVAYPAVENDIQRYGLAVLEEMVVFLADSGVPLDTVMSVRNIASDVILQEPCLLPAIREDSQKRITPTFLGRISRLTELISVKGRQGASAVHIASECNRVDLLAFCLGRFEPTEGRILAFGAPLPPPKPTPSMTEVREVVSATLSGGHECVQIKRNRETPGWHVDSVFANQGAPPCIVLASSCPEKEDDCFHYLLNRLLEETENLPLMLTRVLSERLRTSAPASVLDKVLSTEKGFRRLEDHLSDFYEFEDKTESEKIASLCSLSTPLFSPPPSALCRAVRHGAKYYEKCLRFVTCICSWQAALLASGMPNTPTTDELIEGILNSAENNVLRDSIAAYCKRKDEETLSAVDLIVSHPSVDVNVITEHRAATALSYAASQGALEVVSMLLLALADPNEKDADGTSALQYAVLSGNIDIVSLLIEDGAEVCASNDAKETPLSVAVSLQDASIVNLLVSKGGCGVTSDSLHHVAFSFLQLCRVSKVESSFIDDLFSAIAGNTEGEQFCVTILQSCGEFVLTPLFAPLLTNAVRCGGVGVRSLMVAGDAVEHYPFGGLCCEWLHGAVEGAGFAVFCGVFEVVVAALGFEGVPLSLPVCEGMVYKGVPLLNKMASVGCTQMLRFVAERSVPAELKAALAILDNEGLTALMVAIVARCDAEFVKTLLAMGAPTELQDPSGNTALAHAHLRNDDDLCVVLLEGGALPSMRPK